MRLVHRKYKVLPGECLVRHLEQLDNGSGVPIHAVEGFESDEYHLTSLCYSRVLGSNLLQTQFEGLAIVVFERQSGRPTTAHPIVDARMRILIIQNEVTGLRNRGPERHVGIIARIEKHGCFGTVELGYVPFEVNQVLLGTVQNPRRGTSDGERRMHLELFQESLGQNPGSSERQRVIRAEINQAVQLCRRRRLDQTPFLAPESQCLFELVTKSIESRIHFDSYNDGEELYDANRLVLFSVFVG